MELSKATFVFDADDTLWMNNWQYSQAEVLFFAFIYRVFGSMSPDSHSLREFYFEKSHALFKEYGVRRGRTFVEMLETYKEVCRFAQERFGKDFFCEEHVETLRDLGDLPFSYPRGEWLLEARTALTFLKKERATLCLLSCYDKTVFPLKIAHFNAEEFFSPECTTATEFRKTKDDFIRVSGWTLGEDDGRHWYAVGNSMSDIVPALEVSASWKGILVPFRTTSAYITGFIRKGLTAVPEGVTDPRVTVIQTLKELPELFIGD